MFPVASFRWGNLLAIWSMHQKPALDPNNSGNNCSVSNLLVKVKRIKKIIETKPRYLTSANSLDRSQLILKGKQHPDFPGDIAERIDGCRQEASGQAAVFIGCSASFDISSSTHLGDPILGIWDLRWNQKDLNSYLLLSASRHLWCLQMKFWRVQSSLHLTPIHICSFTILFSDGCNQGSSLSTTPDTENCIKPKKKWVTNSTEKLWQDRWCLPEKGNVYRQGSWKSSNTSAQGICLQSADTSCSLRVCLDSLLLQENIVPFQQ